MPKGYWIVRMDTTDPERYKVYATATPRLSGNTARNFSRAAARPNPSKARRADAMS